MRSVESGQVGAGQLHAVAVEQVGVLGGRAAQAVGVEADHEGGAPTRPAAVADVGQVERPTRRTPRRAPLGARGGDRERDVAAHDGGGGAVVGLTDESRLDALEGVGHALERGVVNGGPRGCAGQEAAESAGHLRRRHRGASRPGVHGDRGRRGERGSQQAAESPELAAGALLSALQLLVRFVLPGAVVVDLRQGPLDGREVAVASPPDAQRTQPAGQRGSADPFVGPGRGEVARVEQGAHHPGIEAALDPAEVRRRDPAGPGPLHRQSRGEGHRHAHPLRERVQRGAVHARIRGHDLDLVPPQAALARPPHHLAQLGFDAVGHEDVQGGARVWRVGGCIPFDGGRGSFHVVQVGKAAGSLPGRAPHQGTGDRQPPHRIRLQHLRAPPLKRGQEAAGQPAAFDSRRQVDALVRERVRPASFSARPVGLLARPQHRCRRPVDARRIRQVASPQPLLVRGQDAGQDACLGGIGQRRAGELAGPHSGQSQGRHRAGERPPHPRPPGQPGVCVLLAPEQHFVDGLVEQPLLVEGVREPDCARGQCGPGHGDREHAGGGGLEPHPRAGAERELAQEFAALAAGPAHDHLAVEGVPGGDAGERAHQRGSPVQAGPAAGGEIGLVADRRLRQLSFQIERELSFLPVCGHRRALPSVGHQRRHFTNGYTSRAASERGYVSSIPSKPSRSGCSWSAGQ